MKLQWQRVFRDRNRAEEMLAANEELFEALNIFEVDDLIEAADNIRHPLYNFIRVE